MRTTNSLATEPAQILVSGAGFPSDSSTGGVVTGALRCLGSRLPGKKASRHSETLEVPGTMVVNPPSSPVIKLFLLQIVPEKLILFHICPKLRVLEQFQVMQCVWIADKRESSERRKDDCHRPR